MIDHQLDAAPRGLAEAFGVCLASVTEVPVADVPLPGDDLSHALGSWRNWLAERGSGLVPIADPGRFQWAGYWIALVADASGSPAEVRTRTSSRPSRSAHRRGSCSARRRRICWVEPWPT